MFQAVEDEREAEQEEEDDEDEEYDSGGSGVALTPPESPGTNKIIPQHQEFKDFSCYMLQAREEDSSRRRDL